MSSFKKLSAFVNKGFASKLNTDDMLAGTIYMLLALVMGMLGGIMPLLLLFPSMQHHVLVMHLLPVHPLLMQFYCVVPVLVCGLSTFFLPTELGRDHMLLGKANLCASVLAALSGLLTLLFPTSSLVILPWCLSMIVAASSILVTAFDACADYQERPKFSFFVWGEIISASLLLVTLPLFAGHVVHEFLWSNTHLDVYGRQFQYPCDLVTLLCGFGLIFGFVRKVLTPSLSLCAISSMVGVASCGAIAWSRMVVYGHMPVISMESFYGDSRILSLLTIVCGFVLAAVWFASVWHSRVKPTVPVLWGTGFLAVIALGWFCYFSHYPALHSMVQISALYAVCDSFYMWREHTHFWYSKIGAYLQFLCTIVATMSLLIPVPFMMMTSRFFFSVSAVIFAVVVWSSITSNKRLQYLKLVSSS